MLRLPDPFCRNADLPQRPDVMQLDRVGVADGDTPQSFDGTRSPPTALTLFHPKPRSGTGIQGGIRRIVARTCLRNGKPAGMFKAPRRFPSRADAFHDNQHTASRGDASRDRWTYRITSNEAKRSPARNQGPGIRDAASGTRDQGRGIRGKPGRDNDRGTGTAQATQATAKRPPIRGKLA